MINIKDLAFLGAKKRLYLVRSKIYLSVNYNEHTSELLAKYVMATIIE